MTDFFFFFFGYGNASFPSQLPERKKPKRTKAKARAGLGQPALSQRNTSQVNGASAGLVRWSLGWTCPPGTSAWGTRTKCSLTLVGEEAARPAGGVC